MEVQVLSSAPYDEIDPSMREISRANIDGFFFASQASVFTLPCPVMPPIPWRQWRTTNSPHVDLHPSDHPILNLQSIHSHKLTFVVGHQYPSCRSRMRGQPEVVITDHLATPLQICADPAVMFAHDRRQRCDVQRRHRSATHRASPRT